MVERIKNFGAQIIVCLAETFSAPKKKHASCKTFFRNCAPYRVPNMNLSYSQNMPICYPAGKYNLM